MIKRALNLAAILFVALGLRALILFLRVLNPGRKIP